MLRLSFDRGTVLVVDPPGDLDAGALPGVLWDPRTRGWRAPAYRHRAIRRALREHGVGYRDEVARLERAPLEGPPLRPYQAAALTAWRVGGGRGTVVIPTGGGKTRVAVAAIAATGLPTICLVPTRVLLHQWMKTLAATFDEAAIGQLGDGRRDVRRVTVATFESALRKMDRIGDRFGLMVVDEAHHFGTGARDEALEMSAARFRLGLTATPPDEPERSRLAELVGPIVFRRAVDDLAGRYLAEYDRLVLRLDLTPAERAEYEREMHAFRDVHRAFFRVSPGASWAQFVAAATRSAAGRVAMASLRRGKRILAYPRAKADAVAELLARHRDSKVLLFTTGNEAAYRIARAHLVMPITCDIGRAERADALERFRRGELRALVSARVLNEGVDVPDADVAIVVGGAHGKREHVQRIGRVLRPSPGKRATVYELVMRRTSEVYQVQRREVGLAPEAAA